MFSGQFWPTQGATGSGLDSNGNGIGKLDLAAKDSSILIHVYLPLEEYEKLGRAMLKTVTQHREIAGGTHRGKLTVIQGAGAVDAVNEAARDAAETERNLRGV